MYDSKVFILLDKVPIQFRNPLYRLSYELKALGLKEGFSVFEEYVYQLVSSLSRFKKEVESIT